MKTALLFVVAAAMAVAAMHKIFSMNGAGSGTLADKISIDSDWATAAAAAHHHGHPSQTDIGVALDATFLRAPRSDGNPAPAPEDWAWKAIGEELEPAAGTPAAVTSVSVAVAVDASAPPAGVKPSVQAHDSAQMTHQATVAGCLNGSGYGFEAADVKAADGTVRFQMAVIGGGVDWVSGYILKEGFWEIRSPQELADLGGSGKQLPPHGSTFLDIGGNIGYFSALFAHHGFNVITVEPMTRNRAALEATLCLNPDLRPRVTVVAAALGAASDAGTPCIIRSWKANNRGNAELRCGGAYTCEQSNARFKLDADDCESVTTRTLDGVLAELAPKSIELAKFDVEGSECNILKGGASLFSKAEYRPTYAQFEMGFEATAACVTAMLPRVGYELGTNKGNGKDANQVIMPLPGFDLANIVPNIGAGLPALGVPEPATSPPPPTSPPSAKPPNVIPHGMKKSKFAA